MLADTQAKEKELWSVRKCLGEAVKKVAAYIECDTAVPPDKVPDLLRGVREAAAKYNIRQISYGHAGDGNIHVNVLTDSSDRVEREKRLRPAVRAIFDVAVSLGGTITGEHGVGCAQSEFLHLCRDEVFLTTQIAIKNAFDPKGLLNPGKVIHREIPPPLPPQGAQS